MPSFEELIRTLDTMRKDVATFRKVVLHLHSPDSPDFGRGFDGIIKTKDKSEGSFIAGIEKSGLDVLAITDHMKCDFACRVSPNLTKKGICILPGLEINFRPSPPLNSFRLHLLAIFPECHSHELVTRIFPAIIPSEKERTGNEEVSNIELFQFVKTIKDSGGICIAAHIDTDNGIRKTFRQLGKDGIYFCDPKEAITVEQQRKISEDFKEWLFLAGFDAIEVASTKDRPHYRWVSELHGKIISIPAVLRNDSHCTDDLANKDYYTYIKMARSCFKELKLALEFSDTRIRFPEDVPATPSPSIMGLEIASAGETGFFSNLRIAFSDNLSCLIGPRGSGKSAIIESLRYVFGLNGELNRIEPSGTELAKKSRSLQEATLNGTIVRVVYKKADNEVNVLESTFDPKQDYSTRVYDVAGNIVGIPDIRTTNNFPIRLFGWSEIETLGREPRRQRELLDRLVSELGILLVQRNNARAETANRRQVIEASINILNSILSKNDNEIKRYKEYKAEFDRLNTPEIDSLFEEIDAAKEKRTIINKIHDNIIHWLDSINQMSDRDIFEGIDSLLAELSMPIREWWEKGDLRTSLSSKQEQTKAEITKLIILFGSTAGELDKNIKVMDEEIIVREKELRNKIGQEVNKQIAADLRRTANERLQRVNQMRREYNEEWENLTEYLKQWKIQTQILVELHKQISEQRQRQKDSIENTLNQFASDEMKITILFLPGTDRSKFVDELNDSGLLTRESVGNYKANRLAWRISLFCTPVEFVNALLANNSAPFTGKMKIQDTDMEIDAITTSALLSSVFPFKHDEEAEIDYIDDEKLLKILHLCEVEWDDFESILLNGRPIDSLSPGQRSSAMLPLIALVENSPLVIDQPEDNLDNRLVGRMLVEVLASLKEKRQIIVATHNPNIVVSGDSEQVIVLDALSGNKGTCKFTGSVDKAEIVDWVIDIMEGGKEAFRTRSKRYKPHLGAS